MSENNCIICFNQLTDVNISVLSCKHKYHMDCIFLHIISEKEKNKIAKCPLCREEIKLNQNFRQRESRQPRNSCFPFINMMIQDMMNQQQQIFNEPHHISPSNNSIFMGLGFSFPMNPN